MSYPQQPGYNPAYQNPYPQGQYQQGGPGGNQGNQQQAFFPPPPMPNMNVFNQGHVAENGDGGDGKYTFQFTDRTIRAAFVRKVFSLVFIMLAVVTGLTALPWLHEPTMKAIRLNRGLYLGGYVVFFVTYLSLVCCEGARRKFPVNLIVTAVFTLATGVMTMVMCAHMHLESILLAAIVCTACTLVIVAVASQTKFDLTAHMGIVMIVSLCFMVFALISMLAVLIFKIRIILIIYSGLGALLMMFYLFLDVQLMMGGRKHELSPEDYIFAAVQIFVDIVQLFWFLLSLIGGSNN